MFKKKRNIGKLLLGSFLIVAVLTACMEEKKGDEDRYAFTSRYDR